MNASSTYTAASLDINMQGHVLSVNPGKSTLGHLNALESFGANVHMPRVAMLGENGVGSGVVPSLTGILFPVKKMNLGVSMLLLVIRLAFAALLVHDGISALMSSSVETMWAVAEIALGAFAAFGLLTRAVMVVPAIAFGMLAAAAPDFMSALEPGACSLVSALLIVVGAGWLSSDALIRVAIRRSARRRRVHGYPNHRSLTPDYPLANLQSPY